MDKDKQEEKQFLEEQVEWCKQQDRVLEQIESKLYDMKELAQYAYSHVLTQGEADELNIKLNDLKEEVVSLEKQLHSTIH